MGYDMYKSSPHRGEDYYRLNIFGMGNARGALYELGIVIDVEQPAVPDPADFPGVIDGDDTELADDHPYRKALVAWREHEHETPGIPVYKLGSNDGWLVTQREIASGVAVADANQPEGWRGRLEDYIAGFVAWMEEADSGFTVW
jgi:hypothetical protein